MKVNSWLENSQFISKMGFNDTYYLETLCFKIASFLKNVPVPICATWDKTHQSIYFSIGDNKHFIPVKTDVAYYDYITLIDQWARQFYPQYVVDVETEIPYTDEEIMELVKQGTNLNDAILMKKPYSYVEQGRIEKIFLKRDEFILNINGQKEIRISSKSINNIIPLSKFMESIRQLQTDNEVKEFIDNNSRKLFNLMDKEKEIIINYSGAQMINFFNINFQDMKQFSLEQIDEFQYKWGIFHIIFESKILRDDCLDIYAKKLKKEK
jgi:hypothetical protein